MFHILKYFKTFTIFCASLPHVCNLTEAVQAVKVPVVLHSVCDSKAAHMNEQRCLIRKLMHNDFQLDHKTADATEK